MVRLLLAVMLVSCLLAFGRNFLSHFFIFCQLMPSSILPLDLRLATCGIVGDIYQEAVIKKGKWRGKRIFVENIERHNMCVQGRRFLVSSSVIAATNDESAMSD
jgi:hypothetical protein